MIALLTNKIPDPTGWHVSTKMDGARAIWTGTSLVSRTGHDFRPPAWFVAGMPRHRMDGELWMGNGTFPQLVGTLQRHGSDWQGIGFHVFDLAESGTVEDRIARLDDIELPGHVRRVSHELCTGMDDLDQRERSVVSAGGEGLVIRRPGSPYRPGRAGDVVKIKRIFPDLDRSILD
jgi:DNA ligase 1